MFNVPTFSEFLSQFNFDSFNFDVDKFATNDLKDSSKAFTEEQLKLIFKANMTMFLALLQQ